MTVFLSVAVSAEDVIAGMKDDDQFIAEILEEMAEAFHRGRLLDNCLDVFRGMPDETQDEIAANFEDFVRHMKGEIGNRPGRNFIGKEPE